MAQHGVSIHPTAIVEDGAELGINVKIGPYSVIGPKVKIDDGTIVHHHGSIQGRTFIGAMSQIWPFATIGTAPQDLKYRGEDAELSCGTHNIFREYSNISIGTETGGMKTVVGSNNLFMAFSHVAHDCQIGNYCIFANGVSLAGHVHVGNRAVLGGHSACHQWVKLGDYCMITGGAMVAQDVAPFIIAHGNRAVPHGLNLVGLKRADFTNQQISHIKTMYKYLFREQYVVEEALKKIEEEIPNSLEKSIFTHFVKNSERGLCR